jgi:hypothetical protein
MMTPTRSVSLPTQAGHQVQFRNGVAVINDTRDLPYLLSRPDVKIEVSEYAMSWMSDVLSHVQVIKAQVHWPEGYDVVHHHADEFDIISPTPPQGSELAGLPTSGEDPVEVSPEQDPLAEALKVPTRKAWRKPPSNSSAS